MASGDQTGAGRRFGAATARHLYVGAAAVIALLALLVVLGKGNGSRAAGAADEREARYVNRAAARGEGIAIIPISEGKMAVRNIDARLPDGTEIKISTSKRTRVTMAKIVLLPHAVLKWHVHVSPFLSTLVSGELWDWDPGQKNCGPVKVSAGTTILEPSNWIHTLVNRSSEPAVLYGMSWTPDGADPLSNRPVPKGCPADPS
jgi:quercetin dioxygenase-like cupin family protein